MGRRAGIIDGGNGDVIIQPSGAVLAEYEQLILQAKAFDDLVAKEAYYPQKRKMVVRFRYY